MERSISCVAGVDDSAGANEDGEVFGGDEASEGGVCRGEGAESPKETQFVKEDNAAAQTRRAFFHQLKEVINRSDVLIIVLDARDPMVGACPRLHLGLSQQADRAEDSGEGPQQAYHSADQQDRPGSEAHRDDGSAASPSHPQWLSLLRQEYPTILFKASTQSQRSHLGRNDMDIRKANSSVISSNVCLGADSVLQLLKNYCRNNGVKTAITVGVIGYPNVGKSSFINSLKRSRAVGVSSTAGYTRSIQVGEEAAKKRRRFKSTATSRCWTVPA